MIDIQKKNYIELHNRKRLKKKCVYMYFVINWAVQISLKLYCSFNQLRDICSDIYGWGHSIRNTSNNKIVININYKIIGFTLTIVHMCNYTNTRAFMYVWCMYICVHVVCEGDVRARIYMYSWTTIISRVR